MKHLACSILLLVALCAWASPAAAKTRGALKTVYAFGYGTCFNDTTVYLLPIQVIEGAELQEKTDFLVYRNGYSHQLEDYLEEHYGGNQTCTVFFAEKKSRLEKKYLKIRHDLAKDAHTRAVELPTGSFEFDTVEAALYCY